MVQYCRACLWAPLTGLPLVVSLVLSPATANAATPAGGSAGGGSSGAGSSASAEGGDSAKGARADKGEDAADGSKPSSVGAADSSDVTEKPGTTYYFVGARYRGTIIPKFIMNLFVNEGATVYSNTIGFEADVRKDGFSIIPGLSYTEYGTGDMLFLEKGKPDLPQNYSVVNSSLKAIYATVDLLWSTPISKNIDFEYGAGFGLGFVFGSLQNNWVYENEGGGLLTAGNGKRYSQCQATTDDTSVNKACTPASHQNSSVNKVGGYTEPNWFNGGSLPVVFPFIAIPQVGLRFKPVKEFEGRVGLGFSLTGFWFGLSGDYGLEKPEKK
jgi:hypothetical protein